MIQQEIELVLGNARFKLTIDDHSYIPNITSRSHTHSNYELFFVPKGEVVVKTEEQEYTLYKNQALLIAPTRYHRTITDSDSKKISVYLSVIQTKKRNSGTDVYAEFTRVFSNITIEPIFRASKIGEKLLALHSVILSDCFCKTERLQAGFTELIFAIYDALGKQKHTLPFSTVPAKAGMQYRYEIDTLLSQNYAKDIDLAFVAKALYLSPKRISVLIKSLYGKSFRQVKTEMRIQVAKQFLKETKLSVSQIAERVGYKSFRGFLTAFESMTSTTPKQYRMSHTAK